MDFGANSLNIYCAFGISEIQLTLYIWIPFPLLPCTLKCWQGTRKVYKALKEKIISVTSQGGDVTQEY